MYKMLLILAVTAVAASATLGEKTLPEFYTVDMDNNESAGFLPAPPRGRPVANRLP